MSVKRYDWGKTDAGDWDLLEFTDGDYVKYADYDALVSVCRDLISSGNIMFDYQIRITDSAVAWAESRDKALSFLDGEKNEGVRG